MSPQIVKYSGFSAEIELNGTRTWSLTCSYVSPDGDDMKDLNQINWEKEENGRFKVFCALMIVFFMAGLFHVHHWNQYFFEIFPLKTAQMMNTADRDDLMRIAEICKERNKHACQIKAYRQVIKQNSNDYVAFELLAETQYLSGRVIDAEQTLSNYFLSGGESVRATYIYARVLAEMNKHDEAETQFKKALKMKPDVVQVSISEDYVKLLMNRSKFRQAKKFIDRMRKEGAPSYFLANQYQEISKKI